MTNTRTLLESREIHAVIREYQADTVLTAEAIATLASIDPARIGLVLSYMVGIGKITASTTDDVTTYSAL